MLELIIMDMVFNGFWDYMRAVLIFMHIFPIIPLLLFFVVNKILSWAKLFKEDKYRRWLVAFLLTEALLIVFAAILYSMDVDPYGNKYV